MLPYWSPYNADGSIASENNGTWTGTGQNPIEWMANNPVSYKKYKVLSTVFADITPIQNLTVRIQFGADYSHATTFMQSFPSYVINNEQGTAGRNSSDVLKLSETATANYRWALNDDHSFNFMLGQEAMDYQSSGFQSDERTVQRLPHEHQLRHARLVLGRHHQRIFLPLVLPARRVQLQRPLLRRNGTAHRCLLALRQRPPLGYVLVAGIYVEH